MNFPLDSDFFMLVQTEEVISMNYGSSIGSMEHLLNDYKDCPNQRDKRHKLYS